MGARRTPSGPPLTEGRLDAVLHRLQLQPILLQDGAPLVQRAPVIQRLGGRGGDCRVCKPVPQRERPVEGVSILHRHGPRSYRGQCDAAGLQDGSSGRAWRLLPGSTVFAAALAGTSNGGPNCSHSPLLRLLVAGIADWALVMTHFLCCSSSRDISARSPDPALQGACTRKCSGDAHADMMRSGRSKPPGFERNCTVNGVKKFE